MAKQQEEQTSSESNDSNNQEAENPTQTGIHAMLDNALLAYERLPMLEVVFDRFIRMMSTSLRNFTADSVEIEMESIQSMRFGDYIETVESPSLLALFKAIEWENFGIITTDKHMIYSLIDVLLGGKKSENKEISSDRNYTTIERSIVKQMIELILIDMGAAFDPLSPATFELERLETNPRFATIAHPSDAAVLLKLKVDIDERSGNISILFPATTLEPIKPLLTQVFVGEKFGKDSKWEHHLGDEVQHTKMTIAAQLTPKRMTLQDVASWKIGTTIVMDDKIGKDIKVLCDSKELFKGKLGRSDDYVAISVNEILHSLKDE